MSPRSGHHETLATDPEHLPASPNSDSLQTSFDHRQMQFVRGDLSRQLTNEKRIRQQQILWRSLRVRFGFAPVGDPA